MNLRSVVPSDAAALADLAREAFEGALPFDWRANAEALVKGCDAGRVAVGVAEEEGEVVGYANLRSWPGGGWIDQVAVRAGRRRRGIGRALLAWVLARARERGFWKVSLVVSAEDAGALAFWERLGFERVGRMRDEIRPGVDGVLLGLVVDLGLHPNR